MFDWMIGKKIQDINILDHGRQVYVLMQDGSSKTYNAEGDCCSSSWIEHVEMPQDIVGATVLSWDEPALNPWDNHVCPDEIDYRRACGHEYLAVYHTRFRTDRGDIVLEYRNDSNGYYGGYLQEAKSR